MKHGNQEERRNDNIQRKRENTRRSHNHGTGGQGNGSTTQKDKDRGKIPDHQNVLTTGDNPSYQTRRN